MNVLFLRDRHSTYIFFFFFLMIRPPPRSTLFPSPTLFRSLGHHAGRAAGARRNSVDRWRGTLPAPAVGGAHARDGVAAAGRSSSSASARASKNADCTSSRDRKSTRLNSSHDQISYAVFCLL